MSKSYLLKQAEIINGAHKLKPLCQHYSSAQGGCMVQRWRGHLGEYEIPSLKYPVITTIIGGRAKIKRIKDGKNQSQDYAMSGDIALVPRNQEMQWRVNGEIDVIAITYSEESINNHLQQLYDKISFQFNEHNSVGSFTNDYLYTNFHHVSQAALSSPKLNEHINSQIQVISSYLLHYFERDINGDTKKSLHSSDIDYVIKRLTLGVPNKINIEDIAEELKITPAYLTKKFKMELGITPHNYLILKRIQKAKLLLAGKELNIVDIAIDCGFSSQSHLTRYFSKIVGLSPMKFRKQAPNWKNKNQLFL